MHLLMDWERTTGVLSSHQQVLPYLSKGRNRQTIYVLSAIQSARHYYPFSTTRLFNSFATISTTSSPPLIGVHCQSFYAILLLSLFISVMKPTASPSLRIAKRNVLPMLDKKAQDPIFTVSKLTEGGVSMVFTILQTFERTH